MMSNRGRGKRGEREGEGGGGGDGSWRRMPKAQVETAVNVEGSAGGWTDALTASVDEGRHACNCW
jgi:hypothetical protein